jgi:hypothetical protein
MEVQGRVKDELSLLLKLSVWFRNSMWHKK